MDESLELRDDIAKLDKKYDGIISDAIKNKSLGKKGGHKNLYLKKGKETKEILLYNIGNEKDFSLDKADRAGGAIFSLIPNYVKSMTICISINKKLKITSDELAVNILHGLKLRSYNFYKYKMKSKNKFKDGRSQQIYNMLMNFKKKQSYNNLNFCLNAEKINSRIN